MFSQLQKRMPILAYHAIVSSKPASLPEGWSRPHAVALDAFCRQLDFMRAQGWISTLPDALEKTTLPKDSKCYILSFDDGHKSDVIAAAAMKQHGYCAIFYVPWSHIEREGFLSRSDIKALVADGFAIGSHGMTHAPLTQKSEEDVRSELVGSKERLEDLISRKVEDLALPFGRYNNRVIAVAGAAGYQRIMTSDIGLARVGKSTVFPRLPVTASTSFDDFCAMVSGGPVGAMRRRLANALSRRFARARKATRRSVGSS